MPQPVSYNPGTPVSGSIQENNISYVVDGQQRNYRGGFGGLSWMSEVPAANNVIFIGNSTSLGRGPANIPLFYPAYNNSSANIVYAANTLPGSPRNFTTTGSAYNWAVTNNFFINNSNNPIPRIDADGLVLYVDANQPSSYPQINNIWYDLSGNGYNGTLTNGPTWNSNGWFQFDGVDDYVNCGNPSISAGKVTVSALVNLNTFSNPGGSSHVVDSNSNSWHLAVLTNGVPYFWNGTTYHTTGTPLSTSRWYMLTGVQGTTLDIYVNGELNNSLNSNVNVTTDNVWIGAWALANRFLNGQVSNTQIYPRALSQSEIKQNYFQAPIVTDGLVFAVDAGNLVSYEDGSTTTYSLTGSFTGNLQNGVSFLPNNGGVFNFDGVDDFIQVPYDSYWDSNVFGTATNFTIECWYKPDLFMNWDSMIWKQNPSVGGWYSSPEGASIWSDANGFQAVFASGVASNPVGSNLVISYSTSTLKWYHLCFTGDGTTLKFYVDGIQRGTDLVANRTVPVTTSSNGPTFGRRDYMNGQLGNSRFYTRGLTASEVQQNYQATKDKFQGQQTVTNGLVLNLDAANKDSYPGTGTTWTNLSGGGYNGTLVNGPSFLPNQNGGIFDFDGTDDYVSYPSLLNVGNTFTVNFWIKPTSKTRQTIVSDGYPYLTNKGFFIACPGNNSTDLFISLGQDQKFATSGMGMITTGAWQMVTARVNGASELIKLYVNGVETTYSGQTDANITLQYDTGVFTTGIRDGAIGSDILNSDIGVLQIYNRALSATEIAQNYNATKTRFGL